jgi:hypothetical protein
VHPPDPFNKTLFLKNKMRYNIASDLIFLKNPTKGARMKKVMVFLAVVVLVFFVLVLARNVIIKTTVESGVSLVTGLHLSIKKINVGIMKTALKIDGLKIYNPKGYEEKIMLDMPVVYVDYALKDILKGKMHLTYVIINLREFNVVKNKNGEVNLNSLKVIQEGQKKETKPAVKKTGKAPEFQLDNLELKVGKITFKDYSKGAEPSVNSFEFNLDEKHQNIKHPELIIALIVQKAFLKASIAKISGFDLGDVEGTVSGVVGDFGGLATDTLDATKNLTGTALNSGSQAKQAAQGALATLSGEASNLKDLTGKIKLPFGNKSDQTQ